MVGLDGDNLRYNPGFIFNLSETFLSKTRSDESSLNQITDSYSALLFPGFQ